MRNSSRVIGVFAAAVLAAACGNASDGGSWYPQPEGPPVTSTAPSSLDPKTVTTPTNGPDVRPDQRPTLTCEIPALNVTLPHILEPGANIPARGALEADRFCIGTSNHDGVGTSFCQLVAQLEARHRAVANCYKKALEVLDQYGADLYDNNVELWREARNKNVPELWQADPTTVTSGVGHLSGWIAAMMWADGTSVASDQFCFKKRKGQTVRSARDATLGMLSLLWSYRVAHTDTVLGALQRGVHVSLTPERRPLSISVRVVEAPQFTAPTTQTCNFEIPAK